MNTLITTNPHDRGYDLVAATDITGPAVGRIWYDPAGDGGLVLRLRGEEYPESVADVVALLASHDYTLIAESIADVAALVTS